MFSECVECGFCVFQAVRAQMEISHARVAHNVRLKVRTCCHLASVRIFYVEPFRREGSRRYEDYVANAHTLEAKWLTNAVLWWARGPLAELQLMLGCTRS